MPTFIFWANEMKALKKIVFKKCYFEVMCQIFLTDLMCGNDDRGRIK